MPAVLMEDNSSRVSLFTEEGGSPEERSGETNKREREMGRDLTSKRLMCKKSS